MIKIFIRLPNKTITVTSKAETLTEAIALIMSKPTLTHRGRTYYTTNMLSFTKAS